MDQEPFRLCDVEPFDFGLFVLGADRLLLGLLALGAFFRFWDDETLGGVFGLG